MHDLPGTAQHQRLLKAITQHYAEDPRVLAALIFGSLARGNWDQWSDLDLDIVLADGVDLDAADEARLLCDDFGPLGERAAAILPKRTDEVDIVLASLAELSIRYHPLATTSPNITDSIRLLCGRLALEDIRAAGLANCREQSEPLSLLLGRCIRPLVETDVALQRRRLWFALEHLAMVRDALIELYGAARGAVRPLCAFQDAASPEVHEALAALVPQPTLQDAQRALVCAIDLLESKLSLITAGQISLSDEQRNVVRDVHSRQVWLSF